MTSPAPESLTPLRSKVELRNGRYEPYVYFDEHTGFRGRPCSTEQAAEDELKRIMATLAHLSDPKPAPASCSEVVERLHAEAYVYDGSGAGWIFDREIAEKILHSWRERRVQELEERLAKHSIPLNSADSALGSISDQAAKETRKDDCGCSAAEHCRVCGLDKHYPQHDFTHCCETGERFHKYEPEGL